MEDQEMRTKTTAASVLTTLSLLAVWIAVAVVMIMFPVSGRVWIAWGVSVLFIFAISAIVDELVKRHRDRNALKNASSALNSNTEDHQLIQGMIEDIQDDLRRNTPKRPQ